MRLLVIGAGGHAKVVIDAARCAGYDVCGAIGGEGDRREVLGVPVSRDPRGVEADAFIVAVGDNADRASTFADYLETGLAPATVIHPSAVVADNVAIGEGSIVAAGVVINVDAVIGRNVILNTGCTIDHDCVIGDHAHVGPGANLCGGVKVGDGSLVGVGACTIPGVVVGGWSVVGAGAAVTSDVPSRSVWAGVPAKALPDREDRG